MVAGSTNTYSSVSTNQNCGEIISNTSSVVWSASVSIYNATFGNYTFAYPNCGYTYTGSTTIASDTVAAQSLFIYNNTVPPGPPGANAVWKCT
jgi:hypothetical protein